MGKKMLILVVLRMQIRDNSKLTGAVVAKLAIIIDMLYDH